ncbi:hypothetical protein EYC84_000999 [Monilinia fructicola]|uniref:Uncharacterized protein n=1 Tax=Monilinia fructicola TaxID=38448 RepID=A0A5M9JKU4_MONFR|nr:hypothetical protein EYC84_000999 [Monilinia fructicola]
MRREGRKRQRRKRKVQRKKLKRRKKKAKRGETRVQKRARTTEKQKDEHNHQDPNDKTAKEKQDDRPNPALDIATPSLHSFCSTVTFRPGLYLQCHSWSGPNGTSICSIWRPQQQRPQPHPNLSPARPRRLGSGIIIPTVQTQRDAQNRAHVRRRSRVRRRLLGHRLPSARARHGMPGARPATVRRPSRASTRAESSRWPSESTTSPATTPGPSTPPVDAHLDALSLSSFSSADPVVVGFGDTIYAYNYTHDAEQALQKQLFRTLRFTTARCWISGRSCARRARVARRVPRRAFSGGERLAARFRVQGRTDGCLYAGDRERDGGSRRRRGRQDDLCELWGPGRHRDVPRAAFGAGVPGL